MEEHFFTERGIYFRRNELKQERLTLLFIHGLSGSSSAWLPYEEIFENAYNIVSLDLRGHGKSLRLSHHEDYRIPRFADDVLLLLSHLGAEKSMVISHSFGSLVALECILKEPGRFQASIFISPIYGVEHTLQARLCRPFLKIAVAAMRLLPLLRTHGSHVDYRRYVLAGEWNIRRIFADLSNTTMRAYLYTLKYTYDSNYDDSWKNITIPSYIIYGEKDSYVPIAYGMKMAREIPGAEMLVLANADHIIVINDFSEVSTALESFLEKYKT